MGADALWCPRCHAAPDRDEGIQHVLLHEITEGRDIARRGSQWQPDARHFEPDPPPRYSRVKASPTSFGFWGRLAGCIVVESPGILLSMIGTRGFLFGLAYLGISFPILLKVWHKANL